MIGLIVFLWVFMSLVLLFVAGANWYLPRLVRPTDFFGWTVAPDFRDTPEGRAIIRLYRTHMVVHALIALLLFAAAALAVLTGRLAIHWVLVALFVALFWELGGWLAGHLAARRRAVPYRVAASTVREASLTPRPLVSAPKWRSYLALLAPLGIVAVAAGYLALRWDDIPERFPIHWGITGEVDGWGTRAPRSVFGPLFLALAVYLPCPVLMWSILRFGRQAHATGRAAVQEATFRRWGFYMIGLAGLIAVVITTVLAVWLPFRGSADPPWGINFVFGAIVLVLLLSAIVGMIRLGQSGHRLVVSGPDAAASGEPPPGDATDDRHWIGGLIYFNRDDPAVWVEKRFGIGWTFNCARPATYVLLGCLLLFTAAEVGLAIFICQEATPPPAADASFVTDPELIGQWRSVDFVDSSDQFTPGSRKAVGELFLKELDVRDDGTVVGTSFRWTKGEIRSGPDDPHPARYEIRSIGDQRYLFFEWVSGDVLRGTAEPSYYVLERIGPSD